MYIQWKQSKSNSEEKLFLMIRKDFFRYQKRHVIKSYITKQSSNRKKEICKKKVFRLPSLLENNYNHNIKFFSQ